jgi:hypothetical protein
MRRRFPHSGSDRCRKGRTSKLELYKDANEAWQWRRVNEAGQEFERAQRTYSDLVEAIEDAYGGPKVQSQERGKPYKAIRP